MSFYGTNCSMIFCCVPKKDFGKAFSIVSVCGALLPFLSNPAYRYECIAMNVCRRVPYIMDPFTIFRHLYDQTLDTNPGAFNYLTAAVLVLAMVINLYIFSQRWRLEKYEHDQEKENEHREMDTNDGGNCRPIESTGL